MATYIDNHGKPIPTIAQDATRDNRLVDAATAYTLQCKILRAYDDCEYKHESLRLLTDRIPNVILSENREQILSMHTDYKCLIKFLSHINSNKNSKSARSVYNTEDNE